MSVDNRRAVSLTGAAGRTEEMKTLDDVTVHDLGIDQIVQKVTDDVKEQQVILRILTNMSPSPAMTKYRQDVFDDILNLQDIRERLLELLGRIDYLKDYGTWRKSSDDKPGLWDLMHRLEEIDSYITAVESLRECLSDDRIRAQGLKDVKEYIDGIYEDAFFAQMKKDIAALKTEASAIRSVTIGINVNSRFEAESMGLVSVNSKPFKKSGIVSNFADAIAARDKIKDDVEWDGDMHYEQVESGGGGISDNIEKLGNFAAMGSTAFVSGQTRKGMIAKTMAQVPEGDGASGSTFYLSGVAGKLVGALVKKLKGTLASYTDVSIVTISRLIPELLYYIRFAEFITEAKSRGMHFCKAEACGSDGGDPGRAGVTMDAAGLYNLKLASSLTSGEEVVDNDLIFDEAHKIYLLTGANRGGKTTITQAVGQLFVLAQGGIFVPANRFVFTPVDMIYTHFPADEDKTMDLGRLGEECVRFKSIYSSATSSSLVLLNESFSTTSFEEGYYIAVDAVKALREKGTRTIFNTHMHKLAADAGREPPDGGFGSGVASVVMVSDEGKRSFKIKLAPPEGSSYARDIAEKYGVTFEMLTGGEGDAADGGDGSATYDADASMGSVSDGCKTVPDGDGA